MSILNGTVFSTGFNFSNDIDATLKNDGEFFVFADFNNECIVDLIPGLRGYTRFEGCNAQKITGTGPAQATKLFDVLFNNTTFQPAFQLLAILVFSELLILETVL